MPPCGCGGSVDANAGLTAAARNALNGVTAMPKFKVVHADGTAEVYELYIDAVRDRMRNAGSELSEIR